MATDDFDAHEHNHQDRNETRVFMGRVTAQCGLTPMNSAVNALVSKLTPSFTGRVDDKHG